MITKRNCKLLRQLLRFTDCQQLKLNVEELNFTHLSTTFATGSTVSVECVVKGITKTCLEWYYNYVSFVLQQDYFIFVQSLDFNFLNASIKLNQGNFNIFYNRLAKR